MGLPVFNQKNIDQSSDADSDNPKFVLCLGDFSYYALVERSGLTIVRLTERFRDTRQIGILAEGRQGGAPLRGEAFVLGTITPNS
jgi:HK97 family phage major capsid protein